MYVVGLNDLTFIQDNGILLFKLFQPEQFAFPFTIFL